MFRFRKLLAKKLRSPKAKKPTARLYLEYLEDRRCPTAVVFAGFIPNTAILNITEVFSSNSPSSGPGSSLTISGNTPPGGGPTSMVTITGGFETTINGMNAVTFTTLFPGAITAINVTVLNDNETITVGTPTGIINLPGTTLNVTVGSGNDTLIMGTAGSATVSEVNNVLNAVNFKAANVNSTGNEEVDILDAMVASVNVQESSGGGDIIRLWGVTANGQVNLAQNNGASDVISIDELQSTNPTLVEVMDDDGCVAVPGTMVTTISSVMGVVKTTQGNGQVDNTTINRTQIRVSLSATQGNGNSNGLFLGFGDTVGSKVTPPGGMGTAIWNGPVLLAQGTGSDDYIGVADLRAGVVSLLQQDLSTNATGDQVGGVQTNDIPPNTFFGSPGLDAPTTSTTGLPNEAGGRPETVNTTTSVGNSLGVIAPTDGFGDAFLEQLNITQGSAAGDIIALVQQDPGILPNGFPPGALPVNEFLGVTGAPFIPGVGSVPGTITLLQQDLAGASSDFIFMGSYNPDPAFTPLPPSAPGFGSPPYAWSGAGPSGTFAIGAIRAVNYLVSQGNASGDILSVQFVTATSPTTALSSSFVQGNGGDDAFFQMDRAVTGGLFNYAGGSGGNYVQADSNNVIGTFDGGAAVPFNVLGQDNNNMSLLFVDFGNVIFA
jgi:hypothetical protein